MLADLAGEGNAIVVLAGRDSEGSYGNFLF